MHCRLPVALIAAVLLQTQQHADAVLLIQQRH